MYLFGVYVSVVELLLVFCGFMALILLYLAFEINKLKKIEKKFEMLEKKMGSEEAALARRAKRTVRKKATQKKKTKKKTRRRRR